MSGGTAWRSPRRRRTCYLLSMYMSQLSQRALARPVSAHASLRLVTMRYQPARRYALSRATWQWAKEAGRPEPRQVSAYAISLDCPRCGARQDAGAVVKSEQPRQFVCAGCGETQDRDVSAAANVARRFVWLQQRGVEKHAGIASEQRTTWETFAAAHPMLELRTPADD